MYLMFLYTLCFLGCAINDGYTKKEYPKTYKECLNVLAFARPEFTIDVLNEHYERYLSSLYQPLICRDAYWKIAGGEMGLGKPWEPSKGEIVYGIYRHSNKIETEMFLGKSVTFEFPTSEMRDAFKENFDPDIDNCKEFL